MSRWKIQQWNDRCNRSACAGQFDPGCVHNIQERFSCTKTISIHQSVVERPAPTDFGNQFKCIKFIHLLQTPINMFSET